MYKQQASSKTSTRISHGKGHTHSARAKYSKYPLFFVAVMILLLVPLLVPNHVGPLLQAALRGPSIRAQSTSPSFTFTAGGDFGGNSSSTATLNLIAQSGSAFHLAIGDLSYSEITPEIGLVLLRAKPRGQHLSG